MTDNGLRVHLWKKRKTPSEKCSRATLRFQTLNFEWRRQRKKKRVVLKRITKKHEKENVGLFRRYAYGFKYVTYGVVNE